MCAHPFPEGRRASYETYLARKSEALAVRNSGVKQPWVLKHVSIVGAFSSAVRMNCSPIDSKRQVGLANPYTFCIGSGKRALARERSSPRASSGFAKRARPFSSDRDRRRHRCPPSDPPSCPRPVGQGSLRGRARAATRAGGRRARLRRPARQRRAGARGSSASAPALAARRVRRQGE